MFSLSETATPTTTSFESVWQRSPHCWGLTLRSPPLAMPSTKSFASIPSLRSTTPTVRIPPPRARLLRHSASRRFSLVAPPQTSSILTAQRTRRRQRHSHRRQTQRLVGNPLIKKLQAPTVLKICRGLLYPAQQIGIGIILLYGLPNVLQTVLRNRLSVFRLISILIQKQGIIPHDLNICSRVANRSRTGEFPRMIVYFTHT